MQLAYGGADAFNALVYGESHPNTVNFLQNQFDNVATMLTSAGNTFMNRGREAFNHFNSSAAIEFARNATKAVMGAFETPHIRELKTLEDFTRAAPLMQRWVMANPVVREKYFMQRLDGYSDTYVDIHAGKIKEDHYDYRRVMDGILTFSDNGDWKITQYSEELLDGDRDLLFGEQTDIIKGWSAMDYLLQLAKDDPTSTVGGKL
jgi:hypothetical protein